MPETASRLSVTVAACIVAHTLAAGVSLEIRRA
jgi:hypothetical protein